MRHKILIVLVLLGGGCKQGYDQSQMARLTATEQAIVGKYDLKTEFNASPSTPGSTSAEMRDLIEILTMVEGGTTTLECFPDKTYVMLVGETSVKGTWSLDKSDMRLKVDKVGEMRPDQIAKVELDNRGVSGWSMTPQQREEFLAAYRNSVALERAESVAKLRVAADGTLFAAAGESDSIFGGFVNYFKKKADKG